MSFASRRGREMASAILPFSPADAHIRGCPARTPALAARYVDLLDSYMSPGGLAHPSDNFGTVLLGHIDRRWLPHLVQANGFRACRRRRQIDRARHQRKAQETSPTRPRHFKSP